MKTAHSEEILDYSVLVIIKRSLNSMTANFDTGVGSTKTIFKKFHYYSLSICPPIFYFLIFFLFLA